MKTLFVYFSFLCLSVSILPVSAECSDESCSGSFYEAGPELPENYLGTRIYKGMHLEKKLFVSGAVEGIKVESPDIAFYGLNGGAPAVVWNPSCLGIRWSGLAGIRVPWTLFSRPVSIIATGSFFNCSFKKNKNLDGKGPIGLFPITGEGPGGEIPSTQNNYFHFSQKETHVNALISSMYICGGDVIFTPAFGYGYIYQDRDFSSQLINYALADLNDGTIYESLNTAYHGAVGAAAISKRFWEKGILTIIPTFGVYHARTAFEATQNWGELGFNTINIPETDSYEFAYLASLRSGLLWDFCDFQIGGSVFVEYLSYVPNIYNPKNDHDYPSRVTEKSSLRYGGGVIANKLF